jgi:hypothetical protein
LNKLVATLALGLTAASLAAAAFAQPPAASIDQLTPPPTTQNRAAPTADSASVAPRPTPGMLGQTTQIPANARASADATDDLSSGMKPQQTPPCIADAKLSDVLAHLPQGAASAIDACAALSWFQDERRADEADASLATAAALAERAEQDRADEVRHQADQRRRVPPPLPVGDYR